LKSGTSDSRKTRFTVGEYKRFENEVGGSAIAKPADVPGEMRNLSRRYNLSKQNLLSRSEGMEERTGISYGYLSDCAG